MISEQQLIIKRLEGLERYNRHLTRVGSTMLILLGAVFVMAQVSPKRTVEAQEFVLLNDNGNVVGKLTSKPKVQLVLTDTYKSEVASLDAHGVDFKNEASGTSCGVWAFGLLGSYHTKEGSGGVELSNSDNPHLLMTGYGNFVSLSASQNGPSIRIRDKENYGLAIGSTQLVAPQTGEKRNTSAASIMMQGKDEKVIWRAPVDK